MQNASTTIHKERRYERRPYSRPIDYSLINFGSTDRKWLDLKGMAVDLSETGIGIQTDYPLVPGHTIWFNGGVEENVGLVRWTTKHDGVYRVGIELDGKPLKTLDEATKKFNSQLEDVEKRSFDPKESPEDLLKAIDDTITGVSNAYADFERTVKDKALIRKAQIRFREKTNRILSKSYFMNRARTWPKGYQGDYKMLEDIYRHTPLSEGIGYFLDLYFLGIPLNKAAITRIKKLRELLGDELAKRQKASVLNIACGSCREVFELASEIERSEALFTCIDLDDDALAFAANRLSYTNVSPASSDQVVFRKYNALRMFDHDLNMSEFGMQDIIYSVGFFDYLRTDFLVQMLTALYAMLRPGGKLIAAFKDARRYRSIDRHWIVDWDGFLERNEEDFREILVNANIPDAAVMEQRDDSGVIIFYTITK
jgi:extracellular factor (EF) 3-hydroxypalmitic acid methyl ester biosynthesis protein